MDPEITNREGDDDEEDEEESPVSTSNGSIDGTSTSTSKKKKKKNKKKKKSESGSSSDASSSQDDGHSRPKVDKAEAEKRFNSALDVARKGDKDDLWIDLSSSSIQPSKSKKLFEALKSNDSVTSVDLKDNQLNDEAMQWIAGVLAVNGAPALIDLDLRDNPVTDIGLKVLEGLNKIRKELMIKTGSVHDPLPDSEDKSSGGKGGASKEIKELRQGKMFKKFFQSGDDDDEPSSLSHQESLMDDRGINPAELWDGIKEVQKEGAITPLIVKLQQLCLLLSRETQAINSRQSNALDGSKPHVKECVANLGVLKACLGIVPRKVTVQFSNEPQSAVGSHRVLVAEVLALLLGPNNRSIDTAVAASGLVPLLMLLALSHALCSSLHARVLRLLQSCLKSDISQLALPLLRQHGWGVDLPDPVCDDDYQGPSRPLPEVLSVISQPALSLPSGSRSAVMGFVLELGKALREASSDTPLEDGKYRNESVKKTLKGSTAWSEFSDGPLHQLLEEQGGDLCGPRPVRPTAVEGSELAELAGGGLMSGREILALLQGMSGMSGLGVMS